jgi:hypothetical protein
MMKLGVYRPKQYLKNETRPAFWPRRTRFAYPLLRTPLPPSPEDVQRFEDIMRHVHLAQGVYRTTAGLRFQTLDAFLNPILQTHFGAVKPLLVEDWAASACITSVEWFESFKTFFPDVSLTASDLHLYLVEILLPAGDSYIVESTGEPLQYIKPPFVIPLNRRESALLTVNRYLQTRARQQFETLKSRGVLQSLAQQHEDEWTHGETAFHKISLIHPRAQALALSNPAFKVESHSVFTAHPDSCHVLRSMNIFNLSYFDKDRLMDGVRAVWKSVRQNGVWMVGRTIQERDGQTPAVHHASVFEKLPTGFRLMQQHGGPSEIEDLALAFRA